MQYRNIELFCNLLLEFFYIDVNSRKIDNFRKNCYLNLTSVFLKTKSKFEKKNSKLRGKATLPDMSPNSTM